MTMQDIPQELLLDFIQSRTSCRAFTAGLVSKEDLRRILDCALAAPSGQGLQTWQFTAVTDPEKIRRLCAAVGKALGREGYDMYKPAAIILTSNEKESRFRAVDNACAMENIYLACTALGLGCVWINQLLDCFDDPAVRAILTEFGVPASHGIYGTAAIGRPVSAGGKKPRKGRAVIVE